jgi:phosphoglycolate phosphatase-like HAD superfamily hydrolase
MLKGIIFDFDGVIAESVQVKTDAFAELYSSYGADVVDKVISHHENNGGVSRFKKIEFYHKSFLNKNINKNELSTLSNKFSKLVINKIINAPYVPGVFDFINNNYKINDMFISTGTPTSEIKEILKCRKILHYFRGIYGSPSNKEEHVFDISSKYDIKFNKLVFIGDAQTDLEAASKFGVKFILRINEQNKTLFKDYKGSFINNFNNKAKLNKILNNI